MAPPIITRPTFPLSQSLPSGIFHKPLILLHQSWKPQSQEINQSDDMDHSLSNSMKLWAMPCRATQDGQVMVERSDKMWSTGEGNGKPLQYSCLESPWTVWKGKKIGQWRMNSPDWQMPNVLLEIRRNNSRNNEETEPKQKQHPAVDVTGDRSKVWCCK